MRKLPFILLFVIILSLAVATIVEKFFGTPTAVANIYNAWWFVALWGACAVLSAVVILRNLRSIKPAFVVHIALLLILAGAFTSFLTSKRGFVHIRQGEILNYFLIEKAPSNSPAGGELEREQLPFNVKLLMFSKTPITAENIGTKEVSRNISTTKTSKGDFFSYLRIDGEICCVYLNHIYKYRGYRFYQYEYDSDEMGVTLLVNRDPYGIAVTYAGYVLLLISALWLLWKKKIAIKPVKFLKLNRFPLLPIVAIPTALVWFFISQIKPMTPVLRSPMLAAHVSVIMISYVLLLLIAVLSAIALIKSKKHSQFSIFNSQLLYPAVFLLAIGIFIGAVWANISWGRYWGWDSKETWALITLLVYAVPFHKKTFPKFQNPQFFHKYLLIAFLSVLMTFLGVSFLLGGIHSYL